VALADPGSDSVLRVRATRANKTEVSGGGLPQRTGGLGFRMGLEQGVKVARGGRHHWTRGGHNAVECPARGLTQRRMHVRQAGVRRRQARPLPHAAVERGEKPLWVGLQPIRRVGCSTTIILPHREK